jgi:hypothetical protein
MPNGSNGPNNRRRGLRNGHWQANLEGRFLPLSDGIPRSFLLDIADVNFEFSCVRANRDPCKLDWVVRIRLLLSATEQVLKSRLIEVDRQDASTSKCSQSG